MHLIPIDDERAVLPFASRGEERGLRLIDRTGTQSWVGIGGLRGTVKPSPDGKLVLNAPDRAILIDPAVGFARHDMTPWDGSGAPPDWTLAFMWRLVDTTGLRFTTFEPDREALKLPDPGYSEPIDATLLPGGHDVAINIVRCEHIALVDYKRGTTGLVRLAGRNGSGHLMVLRGALWMANYDVLCAMDLKSRAVRASSILQPLLRDPQYGFPMNAPIRVPRHVPQLGGWLVPRPYADDILLVDADTPQVSGRLPVRGGPADLVLFGDGTLLVVDYPFQAAHIAHIRELRAVR